MDFAQIQTFLEATKSSVDLYLSNGNDESRIQALDKVSHLCRALERPKDAILRLGYSVSHT